MEPIKTTILAYMHKSGKDEHKEISLPALDRYLVYVKHEDVYVGGKLLAVVQELIDEGLVAKGTGSNILLTAQGMFA